METVGAGAIEAFFHDEVDRAFRDEGLACRGPWSSTTSFSCWRPTPPSRSRQTPLALRWQRRSTRPRASAGGSCARSATRRSTCRASGPTASPTRRSTSTTTSRWAARPTASWPAAGRAGPAIPSATSSPSWRATSCGSSSALALVSRRVALPTSNRGHRPAVPTLAADPEPRRRPPSSRRWASSRRRGRRPAAVRRRRRDGRLPAVGSRSWRRIQLGLEALYRVETQLAIDAFVIDEQQRNAACAGPDAARAAAGQAGGRRVGAGAVRRRGRCSRTSNATIPRSTLDEANFADFCLAVEGVSHFVYVALRAARERPVSPLELELQAEVDKFACCLLVAGRRPAAAAPALRRGAGRRSREPTSASATGPRTTRRAATPGRWSVGSPGAWARCLASCARSTGWGSRTS